MKKLLFILIFGCYSAIAGSPPSNVITIPTNEPINPYLRLFKAVSMVESSNDPLAYNPLENACGVVQVRPIRLKDYNERTGKNYSLQDMYDKSVSQSIFMYYCMINHSNQYRDLAIDWNKSKTDQYWLKVKSILI